MTDPQEKFYDLKSTADFVTYRNNLVYQQGFIIALLAQFIPVTIKRPFKKANVFGQIIYIESVGRKEDRIDLKNFVEKRSQERYELEISKGLNEKTAKRRKETNKTTEMMRLLVDLTQEFGLFVNYTNKNSVKKETIQIDKLQSIFTKNYNLLFDCKSIYSKGKEVNTYLNGLLKYRATIEVNSEDQTLLSILTC